MDSLTVNNTLAELSLPKCSGYIKMRNTSIQQAIQKNREGLRYQLKLEIDYR